LDAELSPNQLRLARKSLLEIEQLMRTISHPFTGELNYIAKGLFGLLSLYLISPALRMDFRALMTLSGLTREGAFDEKGERLRDPDRSKRKTLRVTVRSLIKADLLKTENVVYSEARLARADVLAHISDEGVICWAGDLLHIKNRPIGQKTSVFAFKMPEAKIINWLEVQRILPTALNPSRIDICRNQLKLTLNLLDDLLQKNKITNPKEAENALTALYGPPPYSDDLMSVYNTKNPTLFPQPPQR
jgi:hypothetical protein